MNRGSDIQIHLKLFAVLRDRAGLSESILDLRSGATVADAVKVAGEKHSALVPFLGRIAFALNETYVKADAVLSDGDELALIPPVSGGRD